MSIAKVNNLKDINEWKGVLVVAEQRYGEILNVSYELLGEGRRISDKLGCELSIVVLGNKIDEEVKKLQHYGADKVIYMEHELLENYTTDAFTKALADYIKRTKPEAVFVGATAVGRDLAPRLAGRLGTGLTADCTALDVDPADGKILQTRPAFGGNLMATIICPNNRPQMSTVRPGVMQKLNYIEKESELVRMRPAITEEDIIAKIVEIIKSDKERVSLGEAEIIVAGGRGLGNQESFELVKKLAETLGGTHAASRAAIENGCADPDRQVGQTGTTVRPKVYIACGISGAIQHLAGMSESECIVAINKNPEAPIFNIAHLGIVGDATKIIPEIISALEEVK